MQEPGPHTCPGAKSQSYDNFLHCFLSLLSFKTSINARARTSYMLFAGITFDLEQEGLVCVMKAMVREGQGGLG